VIERLLPAGVVVVEAFADRPGEEPFPGEEEYTARAAEVRRREFVTTRRCAREALAALGFAPVPIPRGPRGQPVFPAGVAGSLTHCAGYRAAAVCRAGEPVTALGIDAEPHGPLPEGVDDLVTLPAERELLASLATDRPDVHWDRLLFSAKESIFKVWYPLTRRELDFTECRLEVDPAAETFTGTVLIDAPDGLRTIGGRYLVERGLVATAATAGHHA
jgi:4'-phosphopantetheinyl transferase EntD